MQRSWTPGIHDLMETLTCRVRVLTLSHVQRGWTESPGSTGTAVESVQRLVKAGLLQGEVRELPPSPVGDHPLCRWSPGDREPDLMRLEQIVRNRWDSQPVPTPIVAATDKAARLFGSSSAGLPPANHCNHDLLLAEVYVRYRCTQPELAKSWLGEDAVEIAERGVKNPDAFLFDAEGKVVRVIESAGRYSLRQLDAFHRHCAAAELPYELW
jgi:hypothetical protein